MAEPFPKDPAALWREMISQWEKGFNDLANKTMASEEFSRSMNQATKLSLQTQQAMGDLMARYLTMLNLPSRAEIANISERLQAIEESLVRIAAAVDRNAGGDGPSARAVPRPPRTKQPSTEGRKP